MTVDELAELLDQLPGDTPVFTATADVFGAERVRECLGVFRFKQHRIIDGKWCEADCIKIV